MYELTPAERRAQKALAHKLVPVVMIGDKGLTGAVLAEIELALSAHGLIKIRVQAERDDRAAILGEICARAKAAPVQHIGKILVVYRPKPPEPAKPRARRAPARKSPGREAGRAGTDRGPAKRQTAVQAQFGRPRRPSTSTGRPARGAPTGTGRPESRTASPRRAPARPPGRRRTSR
ncbi:MAG: YhbY family RNA-binding protein [Proteobacteria bacterium]|nr:YhbY family RNA-binding protein [Pseudomonadota bacterium]